MEGPAPDRTNVRKKILESAFNAFNHRGFKEVTTDDIARELKISKKTLYKIFRSKEEILDAALDDVLTEFISRIEILSTFRSAPVEYIQHFAKIYFDFLELISVGLTGDLKDHAPYVEDRVERFRSEHFRKTLSKQLKAWREKKWIVYPSPTKGFSDSWLTLLGGMKELPNELKDYYIHQFSKSLLVKTKKKK